MYRQTIYWVVYITFISIIETRCTNRSTFYAFSDDNTQFNSGWRFSTDIVKGAENKEFDDRLWKTVDIPHDWSIEHHENIDSLYTIGVFSKQSLGGPYTGYTLGGSAWYRKAFFAHSDDSSKVFTLCFDGIYMLAEIYVNGKKIGSHCNGYTPLSFNITDYVEYGCDNLIAVKVSNPGANSRWYSGSGIYRSVKLKIRDPIYINENDLFIISRHLNDKQAIMELSMSIQNELHDTKTVIIESGIADMSGNIITRQNQKSSIGPGTNVMLPVFLKVKYPKQWSPENPNLYNLIIRIRSGKQVLDYYTLKFGIRSVSFSADSGFLLNGKQTKIRGANIHHDNGLLGAASFYRAEERKIELLKVRGFNAIRTSHNPPSSNFLDICDKLGMMVLDEAFDTWEHPKRPDDYHKYFRENAKSDLESIVLRDRNHPSVIMWSIGNEVKERADSSGIRIAQTLISTVRSLDPTRPVTAGISTFWDHPGRDISDLQNAFEQLDIAGYNYPGNQYELDHERYPKRVMVGTESLAKGLFDNWKLAASYPWVIGDFVWTGMDYLGESGLAHGKYNDLNVILMPWPWYNAWSGDLDLIGDRKPQSFYRDVVWGLSDLEIAVHFPIPKGKSENISAWGYPDEYQSWTWPGNEGDTLQVIIYSRCEKVRIELNGRTIDEITVSEATEFKAFINIPYQPGSLKATGFTHNQQKAIRELKTTGKPEIIKFYADRQVIRADRNDLAFITLSLLDINGNLVINNDRIIEFSLHGDGELIASGNAAPDDMESFNNPAACKTFHGRCMAIVRSSGKPGKIYLTAKSPPLPKVYVCIIVN